MEGDTMLGTHQNKANSCYKYIVLTCVCKQYIK